MMDCKQATRLLSEQQERNLSRREKLALKFHVFMCKACRNFGQQMGTLRDLARSYAKGEEKVQDRQQPSDSNPQDK
ncbi:zf-HC2 domain-containing protein [Microbulbifer agarilyticus]|uniref:zf-HC2 domain-containing protein n=1 Tax=Microbulbifer agarilyticus TaxID=260552 RepID=UPI001CD1FE27|nr:zf-HC2 domain-containing protein [Microbulbifer agarilyticus]MCA0894742.1 zf-HC2 domain-containing protein [Microbulbifer agarilyticus]